VCRGRGAAQLASFWTSTSGDRLHALGRAPIGAGSFCVRLHALGRAPLGAGSFRVRLLYSVLCTRIGLLEGKQKRVQGVWPVGFN